MIAVTRLLISPVKGMELHEVPSIELTARGVTQNRRFYVIEERGLMFNGKLEGRLVRVRAEYEPQTETLALHFPDGSVVAGVWMASEAVTTNFYGRPVEGHVVVGPWARALSEFVGRTVRLVASARFGDALDKHPVTLVSRASIERLRASDARAQVLDERRFRMLIEVDGVDAHAEDRWNGEALCVGSAVVRVLGPVPRCVVTSQNPQSGENDFDTLRAILAYRGALSPDYATSTAHLPEGGKIVFGMYGEVERPGLVTLGDKVALLSDEVPVL